MTPGVGQGAVGLDDAQRKRPPGRDPFQGCAFEIEPAATQRKASTVIHDGFPEDSLFLELVERRLARR